MYTPINFYKLSREGKLVYAMVERYIKNSKKLNVTSKRIHLTPKQYEHLLKGMLVSQRNMDDAIPFGEFTLVRIK